MRPEGRLQLQVCEFLQDEYPGVMFHSDLSAGMALSIGQATWNKRLQYAKGMPDIYIFEARNGYHGLFMELKAETAAQIKKDGTMGKDKHSEEQRVVHRLFAERGYLCDFFIGLEACKSAIKEYLS